MVVGKYLFRLLRYRRPLAWGILATEVGDQSYQPQNLAVEHRVGSDGEY